MDPVTANREVINLVKQLSKDFAEKLNLMHYEYVNKCSNLVLSIESKLNESLSINNNDEFLTIKFSELITRIEASKQKLKNDCSRILVAPTSALNTPDTTEVVFVCSDGSLMVANGIRAAAYSTSFGPQAPHLNFSCSTNDTSSSTIPELLGINHALQTSIILNVRNLVIFTDSTSAAITAGTAILAQIFQSQELLSLVKKNEILRPIFENLYSNGQKMSILAICHQDAHQAITDEVSATNSIADALAKEEAKSSLLSKLPQQSSRPRMTEINFALPSSFANGLTY